MNFLPLIIGLFLFLNKNGDSKITSLLKQIDLKEVVSLLKELGVENELLSFLSDETIDSLIKGNFDLKTFLPIIVKILSKHKSPPKKISPLDDIATGEIKASLFSYLNK